MKITILIILTSLTIMVLFGSCGYDRQHEYTCPNFSEDSQYKPTRGNLVVNYDGFAGVITKSQINVFVFNEDDDFVYFKGCRDEDDYVWIELGVAIPSSSLVPLGFDADNPELAKANAFLEICPDADCSHRRTTEFGRLPGGRLDLEGTIHKFGPGILEADLVLRDLSEETRETGSLELDIKLQW